MTEKNKIREARLRKGLTQKALAELAGTSQQQIQRIEAGLQSARLELASAISRALESTLEEIFPGTEGLASHQYEEGWATRDVDAIAKAHEVGLDIDLTAHTLKILFQGGRESYFPIQSRDSDRINSVLRDPNCRGRIEFHSNGDWVQLNLDHVWVAQMLWDPPTNLYCEAGGQDDDADLAVRVWFSGQEPLVYEVEPDSSDEMLDKYELKDLILYAGYDEDQMLRFKDSDGEWVFLRREDISMISVSLAALYPSLLDTPEEEEPGVC